MQRNNRTADDIMNASITGAWTEVNNMLSIQVSFDRPVRVNPGPCDLMVFDVAGGGGGWGGQIPQEHLSLAMLGPTTLAVMLQNGVKMDRSYLIIIPERPRCLSCLQGGRVMSGVQWAPAH